MDDAVPAPGNPVTQRSRRRWSGRLVAAVASVAALVLAPLGPSVAAPGDSLEYEVDDYRITVEEGPADAFWLEATRITITNRTAEPQTWRIGANAWDPDIIEPLWEQPFFESHAQTTIAAGATSEHMLPRWPGVDFHLYLDVDGVPQSLGPILSSADSHVPVRFTANESFSEFTWQIGREVTTSVDPARAGESVVVRASGLEGAEVGVYFVPETVFIDQLQQLHDLSLDPATGGFGEFLGTVPVTGGDVAGLVTIPSDTAPGAYALLLDDATGALWRAGPALRAVSGEHGTAVLANNLAVEAGVPRTATEIGSDVVVVPIDPATGESVFEFTFDSVTAPGDTTVFSTNVLPDGAATPTTFSIPTDPPVYYLLETTAEFTGQIQLCVTVTGLAEADFLALDLFHFVDGAWEQIGVGWTYDSGSGVGVLCGLTSSLSPFALGIPAIWPFSGFEPPAQNGDGVNVAKAGSTVPIKFGVGGDRGFEILADGSPASAQVDCGSTAPEHAGEATSAPGKGLKYHADSATYSYNWKTEKTWAGTCRQFLLILDDGSTHRLHFRFR